MRLAHINRRSHGAVPFFKVFFQCSDMKKEEKMILIDKFLGNMGIGTRTEVQKMIRRGEVLVNGHAVHLPKEKISEETDSVTVNGCAVTYRKHIHLMMNKPAGYVTATADNLYPTVIDLIDDPFIASKVMPAGRLDVDTEGFVFLTSDGDLNHFITGPKNHIPKTYYAEVEGILEASDQEAFEKGILLEDGYVTKPGKLEIIEAKERSKCFVTLSEGKFHQVKRMFLCLGKKVVFLKRIRMGHLDLDPDLNPGESRELTEEELDLLKER